MITAEARRGPLLQDRADAGEPGRGHGESLGRLQRHGGRPDRRHDVLDPSGVRPDPRSGHRGASRWGTWWGKFHPSDVLPPTGLTATADNATQVTLRWTDLATNETGYVVERKVGAAGTFGVLTSPPLPPNSVTYTDNVGLVAGTTYFYRVGAVGSSGTSYSSEASVTIPGSPPSSGGGGGGGGGGCLSITRSGGEEPFVTSLFSAGILLLPACALGLRRFSRRQERSVPIRHPLC